MKETGPESEGLHSTHRVLGSLGVVRRGAFLSASVLSASFPKQDSGYHLERYLSAELTGAVPSTEPGL